jgi:excisionase family DNA binding protein
MAQTNELITQTEAAELRGVSLGAINELVRRGKLRSEERFGKKLVYRSDVEDYEPSPGGWPKGRPRKLEQTRKPTSAGNRGTGTKKGSSLNGKVTVKPTKKERKK